MSWVLFFVTLVVVFMNQWVGYKMGQSASNELLQAELNIRGQKIQSLTNEVRLLNRHIDRMLEEANARTNRLQVS